MVERIAFIEPAKPCPTCGISGPYRLSMLGYSGREFDGVYACEHGHTLKATSREALPPWIGADGRPRPAPPAPRRVRLVR